jgi:hypothetical protein
MPNLLSFRMLTFLVFVVAATPACVVDTEDEDAQYDLPTAGTEGKSGQKNEPKKCTKTVWAPENDDGKPPAFGVPDNDDCITDTQI